MQLKQNSFKTVLKLFRNCFVSVSFRCADSFMQPNFVWFDSGLDKVLNGRSTNPTIGSRLLCCQSRPLASRLGYVNVPLSRDSTCWY